MRHSHLPQRARYTFVLRRCLAWRKMIGSTAVLSK